MALLDRKVRKKVDELNLIKCVVCVWHPPGPRWRLQLQPEESREGKEGVFTQGTVCTLPIPGPLTSHGQTLVTGGVGGDSPVVILHGCVSNQEVESDDNRRRGDVKVRQQLPWGRCRLSPDRNGHEENTGA